MPRPQEQPEKKIVAEKLTEEQKAEQLKKGELLGAFDESDIIAAFDKQFPEIAKNIKNDQVRRKQLFTATTKEFEALGKMVKQFAEIGEEPDPAVIERMKQLQANMVSMVKGEDEHTIQQLQAQNPQKITLGEGDNALELSDADVFDLMANPNKLKDLQDNLNESGAQGTAQQLSELIATNMSRDTLSNEIVRPEQTLPGVTPVSRPEQVGGGNVQDNILANIRNTLSGFRAGGGVSAGEQVARLSSSLKSARNKEKNV